MLAVTPKSDNVSYKAVKKQFTESCITLVRKVYLSIRPLLELFAALTGTVFFLPVFFIVGILVKLTSKGPVFYTQERVGMGGRLFKIIKFRTMRFDAESKIGPVWERKNDPRITSVGKCLRKTHMDELPQLFNVIKGEMSIIGPRPERPFFVDKFKEEVSGYTGRLSVKPGMSGLAQCHHRKDETVRDVQKKLRYDVLYIKKMCFLLDLRIVWQTMLISLFGVKGGLLMKRARKRLSYLPLYLSNNITKMGV